MADSGDYLTNYHFSFAPSRYYFPPMSLRHSIAFLFLLAATTPLFADAGDVKSVNPPIIVQDPLSKGSTEFELLGGYFTSPVTGHRPEFDYSGVDLRLGIVLSPIMLDHTPLRGDFEFLVDGFADGVTKGYGNYLTGGSVLFRYNFFKPGSRIIPYIDLGGGGLHSDAAENPDQRLIGGNFEFLLQADFGVRFLLTDRWSILLEGGYQHISNADTASRNIGVNALGGRLGLGWLY
jgi:hypothetical protein